ncbi:MAG: zinc ribbon domain-containing protein [Clostridia bacterium]|jgi:uncharacterized membrane protein|nr:MAG: zinc ribbon domain-containing protein [Clostridia bacterium]
MAFCGKCGAQLNDGAKFCPSCGAPTGSEQAQQQTYQQPQQQAYAPVQSDAQQNKVMGILAYLSWLVIVPWIAAKESPFARYHTNQGLVLAIVEIAWWILSAILTAIATAAYSLGFLAVIGVISWILGIVFLVFSILGIVNAAKGEMKPLPIIGGIKILK